MSPNDRGYRPGFRVVMYGPLKPIYNFAIYSYTMAGYRSLNPYLRDPEHFPEKDKGKMETFSKVLSQALSFLPDENSGVLYRGDHFYTENCEVPSQIKKNEFFSTTRKFENAVNFLFFQRPCPVVYIIEKSHSGKDISSLSNLPFEEEVLFDKTSRFEFVSGPEIKYFCPDGEKRFRTDDVCHDIHKKKVYFVKIREIEQ